VPGFKVNHGIVRRTRELLRCRKWLQALPDLLSLRSQLVPVHQLPILKGPPCSSTSKCRQRPTRTNSAKLGKRVLEAAGDITICRLPATNLGSRCGYAVLDVWTRELPPAALLRRGRKRRMGPVGQARRRQRDAFRKVAQLPAAGLAGLGDL